MNLDFIAGWPVIMDPQPSCLVIYYTKRSNLIEEKLSWTLYSIPQRREILESRGSLRILLIPPSVLSFMMHTVPYLCLL